MLAALLWKFKAPLIGFLVAVALVLGGWLWLKHHDSVLLSGYVKQVELTAANAKLETEQRRADASAAALDVLRKKTDADAVAAQAKNEKLEKSIDDYETKLAALGRSCTADSRDVQWVHQH